MKVIVVGCGRVGSELAYRLFQKGHEVSVIDHAATAFNSLPPDFRGHPVEGEPLHQDVLHRAGIEEAQGLAAVTSSDSLNMVVAHVARTVYQVPHVVARNYDPYWRGLHEAFGLQVVSSPVWGAQRVEELLYQEEIQAVFSAGNGEVEIYELAVPEAWQGRTLQDLLPAGPCIPVALTRAGRAQLPSGEAVLEKDDVIHVSATLEGIESLRQRLSLSQEV
jgi:trk system potassium uptake protein TrkA